ncbi:TIGR04222 domain-containing membrane protein [Kitasatospora sp. NBC_00070]|uniref:TIGR04222 domain-containing membrane protein n=1 Tax=Kitasatospora sp. NBC_00070 TaxID=2975962 RepID=UPI003246FA6A
MRWLLLVPAVVLPVFAALLTHRPTRARPPGSDQDLTPYQLAWLRNGTQAFTVTVLVALHLAGQVERLPDGRLSRTERADTPTDPVLATLRAAFAPPVELDDLPGRGEMRQALKQIDAVMVERRRARPVRRGDLAGVLVLAAAPAAVFGLLDLSSVLAWAAGAGFTGAAIRLFARAPGTGLLKALQAAHPLHEQPNRASAEEIVLAVALHGRPAVEHYLPGLTEPGELLWRRPVRPGDRPGSEFGTGGSTAAYSCGDGSGLP